jgi:hypothetical protein
LDQCLSEILSLGFESVCPNGKWSGILIGFNELKSFCWGKQIENEFNQTLVVIKGITDVALDLLQVLLPWFVSGS